MFCALGRSRTSLSSIMRRAMEVYLCYRRKRRIRNPVNVGFAAACNRVDSLCMSYYRLVPCDRNLVREEGRCAYA